jgi:Putative DNA-binding domain
MQFTPLHRLLGRAPTPLSDEMIDEAVNQGIAEADDLDWKSKLPPAKGMSETDYPKDIAAMANSGGGMIVYGIAEKDKRATGREDTDELTERFEQTLRSVAVTSIHPPVFGLDIVQLGGEGKRCVALGVPASVDGPHLIYRGEYFGAPIRNNADTVWMKEREVEAAYRRRFDERRYANEGLDHLYGELAAITEMETPAWLIAIGRPRTTSTTGTRWTQDEARQLFQTASAHAQKYAPSHGPRPFLTARLLNPRPGLRRWVAFHSAEGEGPRREALMSIHLDGAVTVAFALGGLRNGRDSYFAAWEFDSTVVETVVADFMGLLRVVGERVGSVDYEVRIGIEYGGSERMIMQTFDDWDHIYTARGSVPMPRYTPIESTIEAGTDDDRYMHQVRNLIQDCVNQGGVSDLHVTAKCPCDECEAE